MYSSTNWYSSILSLSLWAIFNFTVAYQFDSMPQESAGPEIALGMNTLSFPHIFKPPKGKKTFICLIKKGLFLDKTLLITEILNCKNAVLVFTCPSGWGKSTNLSMLKMFIEMKIPANDTAEIPQARRVMENYNLFTKGEYYFNRTKIKLQNPLLISDKKYGSVIEKYLGRHPVIHLEFPYAMNLITEKNKGVKKLKKIICEEFEKHIYMISVYNNIIRDVNVQRSERSRAAKNKELFENYLLLGKGILIDEDHLIPSSMRFLSQQLSYYLGTKVFILFDEFDELLRSKISDLYAVFLTLTFNNNSHLEKGILMGMLPVMLDSSTGIRNVVHHNFLNTSLCRFYGMTKKEMDLIYNFFHTPIGRRKQIEYWYSGYRLHTNDEYNIFNIWSTRFHFYTGVFKSYWMSINFFSNIRKRQIFQIPGFSYVFACLLAGRNVNVTFNEIEVTKSDLISLKQANSVDNGALVIALKYMVGSGFLAVKNMFFNRENNLFAASLRFPNHEVASYFKKIFVEKWNLVFESKLLELLKNTSVRWENFVVSDISSSIELENQLHKCVDSLPATLRNANLEEENLVFYIIIMSIIGSKKFHFVNSEFKGILLVFESRGIVIEIEHDRTRTVMMNSNPRYLNSIFEEFEKFQKIADAKFVNCDVLRDKSVRISSTLHSYNFNKSKIS